MRPFLGKLAISTHQLKFLTVHTYAALYKCSSSRQLIKLMLRYQKALSFYY